MWVSGLRVCWDCAGQRRVTEQHTENGSIVPLCTSLDRSSQLPFTTLQLLEMIAFCLFIIPPSSPKSLNTSAFYWTCSNNKTNTFHKKKTFLSFQSENYIVLTYYYV